MGPPLTLAVECGTLLLATVPECIERVFRVKHRLVQLNDKKKIKAKKANKLKARGKQIIRNKETTSKAKKTWKQSTI